MKKIQAVIVKAPSQADRVERLVQHCRDLDGTELVVLEGNEGTRLPYPHCNTAALHQAAERYKGQPFLWMEPDAIPLKPHWRRTLQDEYYKSGQHFLLSSDSNPPHDLVGGIGIYGPNTNWLIPKTFTRDAWDLWMKKHLNEAIHWTPLIQHKYGLYARDGSAQPLRFPRNSSILRPDAVLFHRDRYQDLIGPSPAVSENVFRHSGDIGDVIAAMPIFRAAGGGKVVLFFNPENLPGQRPRESLKGARYEALKPLLEAQSYISGVEWGEETSVIDFRTILRPMTESLTERQARHMGKWPIDLSPWIEVPEYETHNRVICARSSRYHNPNGFPWKEAVDTYKDRILFVGLKDEHAAFEAVVGRKVEHAKTPDFLEIAKIMAGSPQVIANQSSPLWVAIGLGCKIICEGDPKVPNSQINRPGSFWAYTPQDMATLRRAFADAARRPL